MKARVIRSTHGALSAGMTGIVTGELEGGFSVLFPSVDAYDGFTRKYGPATLWCDRQDVDLLPDDTSDAPFLLSFALLNPGAAVDILHVTTP